MRQTVSRSAAAIGIKNMTDAKRIFLRQAATWWMGSRYHCPFCAVEFIRAEDAADHLIRNGHPVLRADAPPFVDGGGSTAPEAAVSGGTRTG